MKAGPTDQGAEGKTEFSADKALREHLVECQRFALLGRLSTIVTHEINNHLTGVSGYAQLLLDNAKAADFEKELSSINSSAHRCQKLISDIRRLGHFANGAEEVNNINLILKSCLDFVRHQFERQSHKLVEDFSADVPSTEVDGPALEQVFLNVIQNSFEAFEKRGGCLTVATRVKDRNIFVTLDDDGPGLSDESRENLFTPFFTTKQSLNCPGLGLAAAKMIVEAHGGTIDVGDSPVGGTRVEIALPIEQKRLQAEVPEAE